MGAPALCPGAGAMAYCGAPLSPRLHGGVGASLGCTCASGRPPARACLLQAAPVGGSWCLQQPTGPPRVGGPPAEADEDASAGSPSSKPASALAHRKGPAPPRPADPGPGGSHPRALRPLNAILIPVERDRLTGTTCEPGLPVTSTRVHTHTRT